MNLKSFAENFSPSNLKSLAPSLPTEHIRNTLGQMASNVSNSGSGIMKYLTLLPKGLGQIMGMSCLLPCISRLLGGDKVRDMVMARQDSTMSEKTRSQVMKTIESGLDFDNTKARSKFIWESTMREINMHADLDGEAPNPVVMSLKDRVEVRLLDTAQKDRPLVVNFGSCTSPNFMANLERYNEMTSEFSGVADFLMVYVAEAHPTDGWALKDNIEIASHKTLEERFQAANKLLEIQPLSCLVLVDLLEGGATKDYGALPERLYIIYNGKVVYKGEQCPAGYKLREMEKWLNGFSQK